MKSNKIRAYLALPAIAAAAVGLSMWSTVPYTPLEASSHREAPLIADDPVADNTDLYAFRDPNDATRVVLIANYIPFELPHGGPNYYTFGENVRYEVHVKNDASTAGDNIVYRFEFTRTNEDPTTFFYIRLNQQNLKTTYTCSKSVNGGAFTPIITNGVVPANNVGPRSINSAVGLGIPDYTAYRLNAITTASGGGGEQILCAPSDDPFFADLGAIFDLANLRPGMGATPGGPNTAPDGLSRKNTHSIALSIPIATLQKTGQPVSAAANILDPDYVIGVWASASRPAIQTLSSTANPTNTGNFVQVSRLGMPLTNEVINPIGAKDAWNAATPYTEAAVTDDYLSNPELGLYMADNNPVAPARAKTVPSATYFGEAIPNLMALRIQTKSLAGQPALGGSSFDGFDFRNQAAGLSGLAGSPAVSGTALAPGAFGPYLLVPGKPRSVDIKPIFHTGVPNLAPYQLATGKMNNNPLTAGKPFINNFLPANPTGNPGGDMLRLNMAVPTTPRTSPQFSNQGLLQAAVLGLTDPTYANTSIQFIPNMDGFPNGRRLEDAVDQIELKAVSGVVLAAIGLWYDDFTPSSTSPVTASLGGVLNFTTGVERNDTTFRSSFPYVQTPWIGTGSASGPTNSNVQVPQDLTVSTPMGVDAGVYRRITVLSGGEARFSGPIVVTDSLVVRSGGILDTRGILATNCMPVTGSGSFVLRAGATLRVCNSNGIAASGTTGAIQLTGSRSFSNDATYEFNGGEAQTTGSGLPAQVRGLTVNNAAGVTLNNGGVLVTQLVTLTNGNLVTASSQMLTLRSTQTMGTALVVNTNGVVQGPATVQRAIDPSLNPGLGYRHYSSPVVSTTLSDLATPGFTPVFNPAYNTAPVGNTVTPFPTVFGYDQARVTSSANSTLAFDQGYFSPASGATTMEVLTGYTVNIGASQVVDLVGTLNNGVVSKTNLARGTQPQSGWQFLGNPYPSPIDFSTFGVSRNGMDDAVYVYQSTGQYVGQYRSYVNGIGNPIVPTMQGFFSRVSTPGAQFASITLNNQARVTTFSATPSFFRSGNDPRPLVHMQLQGQNTPLSDETFVYFEQGAGNAFDTRFDAYKIPGSTGLNLASYGGNEELSINGLPLLTGATTVPLNVSVPANGTYTLTAASLLNFGSGTNVYLLDALTGARIDLGQQPAYSFTTSATAMPGRFSLHFGLAGPLANRPNATLGELVQLFPNPAHGSFTLLVPAEMGRSAVSVRLINQLGQLVTERTVNMTAAGATTQFDVSGLARGVYSLHLGTGASKVVKRVVVE